MLPKNAHAVFVLIDHSEFNVLPRSEFRLRRKIYLASHHCATDLLSTLKANAGNYLNSV